MRVGALGLATMLMMMGATAYAETKPDFRKWAEETQTTIEQNFSLPDRGLYADETKPGGKPGGPAFMWGCGVQLTALNGAEALGRRKYAPLLKRYADGLQVYWQVGNGVGGYDVLPGPKGLDRYYDDNMWIVLALADAYEQTKDKSYLDRAELTMKFVMSGEDDKLGGGIYWHEQDRNSKNTCSNGPAIAAALRLYQLTHKQEYLEAARRLYQWLNSHLLDTDGLYWDNIHLNGQIEKTKWSYNTALMIRSNCLFYQITRNKIYLLEAERLARASEARWVKPDTGAITDGAAFAHLLAESLLHLYEQDHDRHWRDVVQRALIYLHDNARDPNGFYPGGWDKPQTTALTRAKLIDQAAAARAYWLAARYK